MPDFDALKFWPRLLFAVAVAGLASLVAALAGLTLFLAGSFAIGLDIGAGHPVNLALPTDLFAHGPLGWATWMVLLMACGAPILGIAVFTMLYLGRSNAN